MRILDKKIKSILDINTNTHLIIDSLDSLSNFITDSSNTSEARKSLRNDIETNGIELCKSYCSRVGGILNKIKSIESSITYLETKLSTVLNSISQTETLATDFLDGIKEINNERSEVEKKSETIIKFLKQYIITDDQKEILSKGPIESNEFFETIINLNRVYDDCSKILENGNNPLELSCVQIMDSTSEIKEVALKRLFQWCLYQCQIFSSASITKPNFNFFQSSLKLLFPHQLYFTTCINSYIQSRKYELIKNFTNYLKGLQSNSSLDGISNMLSFIYQVYIQEKDYLSLMEIPINNNLSSIISGYSKNVLEYFEQTISDNSFSFLDLFQIYQIISYYLSIYSKDITEGFTHTIQQIAQTLESQIGIELNNELDLLNYTEISYNLNLNPQQAYVDFLEDFTVLVGSYHQSNSIPMALSIEKIYSDVIPRLLLLIEKSSSTLDAIDQNIYELNTLEFIYRKLLEFQYGKDVIQILENEISKRKEAIDSNSIFNFFIS